METIFPDQADGGMGCMIVPNAVVLIKGGPNAQAGKKLIDYLLSKCGPESSEAAPLTSPAAVVRTG